MCMKHRSKKRYSESTSENALDTADTMASFDSDVAPLADEPIAVTVPAIQQSNESLTI